MFCSECGSEVVAEAKFCQKCGTALHSESSSVEQAGDGKTIDFMEKTRIESDLKSFPFHTIAHIKCHHCHYIGQMGILSEEFQYKWWILVGFTLCIPIVIGMLFGEVAGLISFGLAFYRIYKSRNDLKDYDLQCPACKGRFIV
jgi:hypothetical protein